MTNYENNKQDSDLYASSCRRSSLILPLHFDSDKTVKKWIQNWETNGIYRYDPSRPRSETFVVDTPPPTVSGSLHIGHIFSYTHTDIIVRYKRMQGFNIFYPMGWDDNGLPTERRVQNYFNVGLDLQAPYDPSLLTKFKQKANHPTKTFVSRKNFLELCDVVTHEDEQQFKQIFQTLGLSVDWNELYTTINKTCRTIAQLSFLDLYQKSQLYQSKSPVLFDITFQTAVAQAESEDREIPGTFHNISFTQEDSSSIVIATTRPELLAACVAITVHPDDERYKHLIGKHLITPLFHVKVPVIASTDVSMEKGTGIVMICTFGDQTDVKWFYAFNLPLRQIISRTGHLLDITFGTEEFPSLNPDQANLNYKRISTLSITNAKKEIVKMLKENDQLLDEIPLQHPVKFFEKGDQPLELIPTRQWFVKIIDHKQKILTQNEKLNWCPQNNATRFQDWTNNINRDWCVSRQRPFGVPIPIWYKLDEKGQIIYDQIILPDPKNLPIDPTIDAPPNYNNDMRGKPQGFIGEKDVFDTWFTSSLTPLINARWKLDNERFEKLFPADLRPQSHEIIRTWAFYTVLKSLLHNDNIPWYNVSISGWILAEDKEKMSKSKGNTILPKPLLENFGSDGVRYWAGNAVLGVDTAFDKNVLGVGKRLTVKLWNASKWVLNLNFKNDDYCLKFVKNDLDILILLKLKLCVEKSTKFFDKNFQFSKSLKIIEEFFWKDFTDFWLELVKERANNGDLSAIITARFIINILLRLFAPFLPFITEELWSYFNTESKSIHLASWPKVNEWNELEKCLGDISDVEIGKMYFSEIRESVKLKMNEERKKYVIGKDETLRGLIEEIEIGAKRKEKEMLERIIEDILFACGMKKDGKWKIIELNEIQDKILKLEMNYEILKREKRIQKKEKKNSGVPGNNNAIDFKKAKALKQRVFIWDKTTKTKIQGPTRKLLEKYLANNPDREEYSDQDLHL